jgi:antitoxin component of MazEF toxin-antitoxin module
MTKRIIDAKIWKTGNALVVTIPSNIIEGLGLKKGESVEITINKNHVAEENHKEIDEKITNNNISNVNEVSYVG